MGVMDPREMARFLGRKGGRSRARRLSATEKIRIARMGAKARLQSLRAARRIADNFRYVAATATLRRPVAVKRVATFKGPLPGIYPTTK
jgi:hypothetical protein